MEQEMSSQSDQHVSTRRYREHKAEVSAAQQRKIAEHPGCEDDNAQHGPGVEENLQIIERGGGDNPPYLTHTVAERNISQDIGNDHQQDKDSCFLNITAVL